MHLARSGRTMLLTVQIVSRMHCESHDRSLELVQWGTSLRVSRTVEYLTQSELYGGVPHSE